MLLLLFVAGVCAWQALPPVSLSADSTVAFPDRKIYIDANFANTRDWNGLTTIPPTALEFAETFRHDLEELTANSWSLQTSDTIPDHGIFLGKFRGDAPTLENGLPTEEAYELEMETKVFIGGVGARGMYWGTRSLLQHMLNSSLPRGRFVDAPAYSTRGYMLDAGRKWYSPEFLKDLCTYASFFKMSEFHYHASDNYPLSRGRNETWTEIYSHFSFMPEDESLHGLIERGNETLSRDDFEDLQHHCAQRGITVIPEIEAPGHSLAITKWKPELALEGDYDLLNLSHPDTIPTVKAIWEEFLPWFQTKEVHIGADEYDSELADDYINFVNEMASFMKNFGRTIRIWGTYEPSDTASVSKDIVVQHWQYGQSDPVELQREGYNIINSQDWWAYITLKNDHTPILPAPYPQFFNKSRVLNFANEQGWQWNPALFNQVNTTEQLDSTALENKGAIMATWNDNGPDATTQLEAYYAMRRGLPLVAARAWSGSRGPQLIPAAVDKSIDILSRRAPAQNLDRKLPVKSFVWERSESDLDSVHIGLGSKGLNYALELQVNGPFTLSSKDAELTLDEGELKFIADGWPYPLRSVSEMDGFDSGHPGRIWTNTTGSTHEPVVVQAPVNLTITGDAIGGSRAWINDEFVGRFEVFIYGGRNTLFSWSQMTFVAPLDFVRGGVQRLTLQDGVLNC